MLQCIIYMQKQLIKQLQKRELTGSKIIIINPWMTKINCVICKQNTQYATPTPLIVRQNYVEGLGQLCKSCYFATYCNGMINDEFLEEIFS